MRAARFHTVSQRGLDFGQLSIAFRRQSHQPHLTCDLLAGKDFFGSIVDPSISYQVRCYLLPNDDVKSAAASLFKPSTTKKSSAFKKRSANHAGTTAPILRENMVFDLSIIASCAADFSLYFAIVASEAVSADGSHCAGCFAIPLRHAIKSADSQPRWYWFLHPDQGLSSFKIVTHELDNAAEQESLEPDVKIHGRHNQLPNASINGTYTCQSIVIGGRHVFRFADRNLYLYFMPKRTAWVISDSLNSISPLAYVVDASTHPATINGTWMIFNKEREYSSSITKMVIPQAKGVFEPDRQIHSTIAQAPLAGAVIHPVVDSPSTASARSSVEDLGSRSRRPTQAGKKNRALAFAKLVTDHTRLHKAVQNLNLFREELQAELSPMERGTIFLNSMELEAATTEVHAILADLSRQNQASNGNVGSTLRKVHDLLDAPLVAFCQRLPLAQDALQKAVSVDPSMVQSINLVANTCGQTLQDAMNVPKSIADALPTSMGMLVEATASSHSDYTALTEMLTKFTALQASVQQQHTTDSFKTRAPSSLLDNMMAQIGSDGKPTTEMAANPHPGMFARSASAFAGSHDASISSLPEMQPSRSTTSPVPPDSNGHSPDADTMSMLSGVSAYAPEIRGTGGRMSMVPDADVDDDELPKAVYRPSVPLITAIAEQEEEDEDEKEEEQPASNQPITSIPASPTAESEMSTPAAAPSKKPGAVAPIVKPVATKADQPVWFHPGITKEQAVELLDQEKQNGHFLVRERPGAAREYVLSLIYKGNATHHLMKTNEQGVFTINRKVFGTPAPTTMADAIARVAAVDLPKGWPQRLVSFVPRRGASQDEVEKAKQMLGLE